jgi:hypothetical protein
MSTKKKVVDHSKGEQHTKHETGPVHIDERGIWYFREGEEDNRKRRIRDGADVEKDARFAQIEARRKQRLSNDSSSQHAANSGDVADGATESSQGNNNVEGDGRANNNEAYECREYKGEYD